MGSTPAPAAPIALVHGRMRIRRSRLLHLASTTLALASANPEQLKRNKNACCQKRSDIRLDVIRQRLVVFVIDPLHPDACKNARLDAMALEQKYARRRGDRCDLW